MQTRYVVLVVALAPGVTTSGCSDDNAGVRDSSTSAIDAGRDAVASRDTLSVEDLGNQRDISADGPVAGQDAGLGDGAADAGADAVIDAARDGAGQDASADLALDRGGDTTRPPEIASVDYAVIAHGAKLVVTGSHLAGATAVSIGGLAQTFVADSDSQITIGALADATPLSTQPVVVTGDSGSSAPFNVTVIHLVISEVDSDTLEVTEVSGSQKDSREFIEISAGVASADLSGYVVVLMDGNDAGSYRALPLNASTDSNGRLWIGPPDLLPTPALFWDSDPSPSRQTGRIQDGPDAITIYQGSKSEWNSDTPATATGLIDAVFQSGGGGSAMATQLKAVLLGTGAGAVELDDNANGNQLTQSLQRCASVRLDGRSWLVADRTPGANNNCL